MGAGFVKNAGQDHLFAFKMNISFAQFAELTDNSRKDGSGQLK
jgi:hypothetical protein